MQFLISMQTIDCSFCLISLFLRVGSCQEWKFYIEAAQYMGFTDADNVQSETFQDSLSSVSFFLEFKMLLSRKLQLQVFKCLSTPGNEAESVTVFKLWLGSLFQLQKIYSKSGNSLQLLIQIKNWHKMPDKYSLCEEEKYLTAQKKYIFFIFVVSLSQSFSLLLDVQCSVKITEF